MIRTVAVTGDNRVPSMPEVPTLIEQGFPGLTAFAWWGIFAPAGTPKPIVDKFHAELLKAFGQAEVRKTLTETLGMELVVSSPDALQQWTLGEMAKWGKVIKDNNIKLD